MNKNEEFAKRQEERMTRIGMMSEEDQNKLKELTVTAAQMSFNFAIQSEELTNRLIERSGEFGNIFIAEMEKLAANHVNPEDDILSEAEMKMLKRIRSLKKADDGLALVAKIYMRQARRLGEISERSLDGLIDQFLPEPEPVPSMTTEFVSMGGLYPDEPEGGDQN